MVVISNYYNYLQGLFSRALKSKAIISCNIKGFRGAFICSPQRHMKKMWGKISKNINWVKNGLKFKFCKDFLFRYKPCSHPLKESGKCLLHYGKMQRSAMLCHTEPPGGHFIKRLCMSIIRLTHTDSPEFPDSGKSFKVSVISLGCRRNLYHL